MNDFLNKIKNLSQKQLMLLAAQLQEQVVEAEKTRSDESIAIIGMGCRLPGDCKNTDDYWDLLKEGRDGVTEFDKSRWESLAYTQAEQDTIDSMGQFYGGVLNDIDQFDADFFGITPREAALMDPSQRITMEVAWETVEAAGYSVEQLKNKMVGVYLGVGSNDYIRQRQSISDLELYSASGAAISVNSGRISYYFGWRGPSISIDTACSSSLVTVHNACQALLNGDCDYAMAGGVNMILSPTATLSLTRGMFLSPDGRCKTFDKKANGFVRSEGCGLVMLKRLSDAQADGDNILAVIKGSATNQDGRSQGMMAPNGPSQEDVISRALKNSGVDPATINYVEAHGTGTELGDPIEVNALDQVYGQSHSKENPLLLGSVKTNIGHLEVASGVAGLIKLVLSLQNESLPAHINLTELHPLLGFDEKKENNRIQIPTEQTPWPASEQPRRCAASAFGFSGTNAHVILEEAPQREKEISAQQRNAHPLVLSAKTQPALNELVQRYVDYLGKNENADIADICYTAATGRSHHEQRLALVTNDIESCKQELERYLANASDSQCHIGEAKQETPSAAFLFTGQGAQYLGMGKELYQSQPYFRQTLDRCAEILTEHLDKPLLSLLWDDDTGVLNETQYTQPAMFAVGYSLAKLWMSWGIEPKVLMGHSVGEYIAACVAGVFSLEDGLKLIAGRGRLMASMCERGKMLSVFATRDTVEKYLAKYSNKLSIAAENGDTQIVVSGYPDAIDELTAELADANIDTQALAVSHAFHSPMMDVVLPSFKELAETVEYHEPKFTLISNLKGQRDDNAFISADYWVEHLRAPVEFNASVTSLIEENCELFIELGPRPVLLGMARRNKAFAEGVGTALLPSLQAGRSELATVFNSLAQCYTKGSNIDWLSFDKGFSRSKVVLPHYPFQRKRYWLNELSEGAAIPVSRLINADDYDAVLGSKLRLPFTEETRYEMEYSHAQPSYLSEHKLFGRVVVPGATYLALMMSAIEREYSEDKCTITSVLFEQPLVLAEDEQRYVQVVLQAKNERDIIEFQIISALSDTDERNSKNWLVHCTGQIQCKADITAELSEFPINIDIAKSSWEQISSGKESLYGERSERGYNFGDSFQWLAEGWQDEGQILRRLQKPELAKVDGEFQLHPGIIDGCLQIAGDFFTGKALDATKSGYIAVPFSVESVNYLPKTGGCESYWCYAKRRDNAQGQIENSVVCDIVLMDDSNNIVFEVKGFDVRKVHESRIASQQKSSLIDWMYKPTWQKQALFPTGHQANYIPGIETITGLLKDDRYGEISYEGLTNFPEISGRLESMTVDYVVRTFYDAGVFSEVGQEYSFEDFKQKLSIIPEYEKLLQRFVEIVCDNAYLEGSEKGWRVAKIPEDTNLAEENAKLAKQYPVIETELELLGRCGAALGDVLKGEADGLELLFPKGELDNTRKLYDNSVLASLLNALSQKAMKIALEKLPEGRGLRVLEIGAGTGATTTHILPVLPKDRVSYTYTDISAHFTQQAKKTFKEYPFIDYRVLDIEKEPEDQGFEAGAYDIIVAANVLHATTYMHDTMSRVNRLLAPGGMLLLVEGVHKLSFLDVTFGLTEGWWRFSDDSLRTDYPLMPAAQWQSLLNDVGFDQFVEVNSELNLPQSVMLAKAENKVLSDLEQETKQKKHWLILDDQANNGRALVKEIEARGEACIIVNSGEFYQSVSPLEFTLDPEELEDFRNMFMKIQGQGMHLEGVINFWPLDSLHIDELEYGNLDESQTVGSRSTLYLVNALNAFKQAVSPQLTLITRGAQSAKDSDNVSGLSQSTLWGMSKVIDLEHPELNCVRIDLEDSDETTQQKDVDLISHEIFCKDSNEDQVAYRKDGRYVTRLKHFTDYPFDKTEEQSLDANASYLVTGGLGGLGLLFAQWLAKRGAKHLVLVGRRQPDEDSQKIIEQIRNDGVNVVIENIDISSYDHVASLIQRIDSQLPTLKGLIHSAGQLDDGIILQQGWQRFQTVMAAKVLGSWSLHTLTKDKNLDFFVLFSSMTAVLGNKGQVNHAAANAFEDALIMHRRANNLPGLSVNWGAWSEVGAAARRNIGDRLTSVGGGEIDPVGGVESFELLFDLPTQESERQIGIMPMTWTPEIMAYYDEKRSCYLQEIKRANARTLEKAKAKSNEQNQQSGLDYVAQLQKASAEEQVKIMLAFVKQVVGLVSRKSNISEQDSLIEMGIDSLMAMEVRAQLKKGLDLDDVAITMLLDGSTIEEIANTLCTVWQQGQNLTSGDSKPGADAEEESSVVEGQL